MSLQHVVSKAQTELHVVVKWHKRRIMKFTNPLNIQKFPSINMDVSRKVLCESRELDEEVPVR